MTAPTLIAVGTLGGVGAIGRFLVDAAVTLRSGRALPVGTLVVNLSGAFLLGVLAGAAVPGGTYRLLGTGFVGAYTTFSTWTFESHRLAEDGRFGAAAGNVAVSLLAGLLAVWLGQRLGGAL